MEMHYSGNQVSGDVLCFLWNRDGILNQDMFSSRNVRFINHGSVPVRALVNILFIWFPV